ncbi:MAG: 3-deoxy-D-manno-octulosonic acid transferase [Opitutaceae bacterium]
MIWVYRFLFAPALIVLGPVYLRRMLRRGGYRENFSQRVGRHRRLPPKRTPRIWIQAVSVGELLAIGPLLETLRAKGLEIYLTTTTSTGYRLALDRYGAHTVGIGYFPIDWCPFSAQAWAAIEPDLVVLTEGERWPEHARQAARHRVPVVCVNARLSDRSFRRLRRFPFAARLALDGLTRVLAASRLDGARFRALGVPPERLSVTGNLKLDVSIPPLVPGEGKRLKSELGLGPGPIVLGASTWPGEETALVAAVVSARAAGLACSLLLVPRHAERRNEIESDVRAAAASASALRSESPSAESTAAPWTWHFRSHGPACGAVDVAIADTTGELQRFLQVADLVFVGKSLWPNTEGQTPVEAAALGKPILFGPGMSNFRVVARDLLARDAARRVKSAEDLAGEIARLLRDPNEAARLGKAAFAWREENRGALDRTVAGILEALPLVPIGGQGARGGSAPPAETVDEKGGRGRRRAGDSGPQRGG